MRLIKPVLAILMALAVTVFVTNSKPALGQAETSGRLTLLAARTHNLEQSHSVAKPKCPYWPHSLGALGMRYRHDWKRVHKLSRKAAGRDIACHGVVHHHGVRKANRRELTRSAVFLEHWLKLRLAPVVWLHSTAYCGGGTMSNGHSAHVGAVAVLEGQFRLGTHFHILTGSMAGADVVAEDHIGHGSQFDIYMSTCSAAIAYGPQTIKVALT